MFTLTRSLVFGTVASIALTVAAPTMSQADHRDGYWENYWQWYDGRYRPHYQHRYRRPYYDDGRNYYYRPPYYQRYGYGPYYYYERGGREGVNVGPFRFEWR